MPYQAEISREHPTCFLFVIDQSGSMDEITEAGRSKAGFVADVLNKTLYTLVTNCSKADGVRNYFDVGVIAYSGSEVAGGFGGALSEDIVHPIHAISEHTLRVEERKKKIASASTSTGWEPRTWPRKSVRSKKRRSRWSIDCASCSRGRAPSRHCIREGDRRQHGIQ
jgi:hypothetical protein